MDKCVKTICPLCRHEIETTYILLGAEVDCPACRTLVIPQVFAGTVYPVTGYEITYRDFRRLLTDLAAQPQVFASLCEWYGYAAPLTSDGSRIFSGDGGSVSSLPVHLRIQSDGGKQYSLYQTAMNLWR